MTAMYRSKVVKIGNSRGIRIPQDLLEQAGLTGDVEMVVEGSRLIIHSIHSLRQGWTSQFAAMTKNADDRLVDQETPSQWDKDEWEW